MKIENSCSLSHDNEEKEPLWQIEETEIVWRASDCWLSLVHPQWSQVVTSDHQVDLVGTGHTIRLYGRLPSGIAVSVVHPPRYYISRES